MRNAAKSADQAANRQSAARAFHRQNTGFRRRQWIWDGVGETGVLASAVFDSVSVHQKRRLDSQESGLFLWRRIGMIKPPVQLGVMKNFFRKRNSLLHCSMCGVATTGNK